MKLMPTSLLRLAQKLLFIYRLLPSSTTSLPNLVSSPFSARFTCASRFQKPLRQFCVCVSTDLFLAGSLSCSALPSTLPGPSLLPPAPPPSLSRPTPASTIPLRAAPPSPPPSSLPCVSSSTCVPSSCTTPSNRLNLSRSSLSGGLRGLRGALPGAGNMHSMCARAQFAHGCFLSHFTLRLRQVTQDRGFALELVVAVAVEVDEDVVMGALLTTRSVGDVVLRSTSSTGSSAIGPDPVGARPVCLCGRCLFGFGIANGVWHIRKSRCCWKLAFEAGFILKTR